MSSILSSEIQQRCTLLCCEAPLKVILHFGAIQGVKNDHLTTVINIAPKIDHLTIFEYFIEVLLSESLHKSYNTTHKPNGHSSELL